MKLRTIQETPGESLAVGKISKGCGSCIAGRKMVLFISGVCPLDCWYCTISHNRWQKDDIYANERPVKKDEDIIAEAKVCGATGAGITGGEPAAYLDRVIHYIKLLKTTFGKSFHIHMYTSGWQLDEAKMKMLYEAGLDEIRFHIYKDKVPIARKFPWKVGMEIPCIPGEEKKVFELIDFLDANKVDTLNLNELEFSERNNDRIEMKGFFQKDGTLTAIDGSYEAALKALKYARGKSLTVHFCTAALKLNYQLRNRLINRANNIKKPFEIVTDNGFLLKGVVFGSNIKKISSEMKKLVGRDNFVACDNKNRIEFSAEDAEKIAQKVPFKVAIVEEYPSAEPWDFEVTPLNYRVSVPSM